MALDLALDSHGDLVFSANNDISLVAGAKQTMQRIHTRIAINRDEWVYDPTSGRVGSRLRGLLGLPRQRFLDQVQFAVQDALSSMRDIRIESISVEEPKPQDTEVKVHVFFTSVVSAEEITTGSAPSPTEVVILRVPTT